MCELEAMMVQLLELAKDNPELLFQIVPNEEYTNWAIHFTKGGHWWAAWPEGDETLSDAIKEVIPYFHSITDEMIQDRKEDECLPSCHT